MDQCVEEFNGITDQLGRQVQIEAYAAHLNLNNAASVSPAAG